LSQYTNLRDKIAGAFDMASGLAFYTGMACMRVRDVPNPVVSLAFTIIALSAYLIGYGAWLLAALLYKEDKPKTERWYGFTLYKKQIIVAAMIGLIATILSLAMPELFAATACLFFISNLIWAVGEYHKIHNKDLHGPGFSTNKQKIYFVYAGLTTFISLMTASMATTILLYPDILLLSFPVVGLVSGIGIGLMVISIGLNLFTKTHFPPDDASPSPKMTLSHPNEDSSDNNRNTVWPSPVPRRPKTLSPERVTPSESEHPDPTHHHSLLGKSH